jgi:hypothetical protein
MPDWNRQKGNAKPITNPLSWANEEDWSAIDAGFAMRSIIQVSSAAIGAERIHPTGNEITNSKAQATPQLKEGGLFFRCVEWSIFAYPNTAPVCSE